MTGTEEVAWDNFEELKQYIDLYSGLTRTPFLESFFGGISIERRKTIFVRDIKLGRIKISPEFMCSLESPELKKIVIEAICLAKV